LFSHGLLCGYQLTPSSARFPLWFESDEPFVRDRVAIPNLIFGFLPESLEPKPAVVRQNKMNHELIEFVCQILLLWKSAGAAEGVIGIVVTGHALCIGCGRTGELTCHHVEFGSAVYPLLDGSGIDVELRAAQAQSGPRRDERKPSCPLFFI
jgi:hypothetical protein